MIDVDKLSLNPNETNYLSESEHGPTVHCSSQLPMSISINEMIDYALSTIDQLIISRAEDSDRREPSPRRNRYRADMFDYPVYLLRTHRYKSAMRSN